MRVPQENVSFATYWAPGRKLTYCMHVACGMWHMGPGPIMYIGPGPIPSMGQNWNNIK